MEVESPTFPVVGKVQGREARAKAVGAVVEAGDPAAEVEVVHWAGRAARGRHSGGTPTGAEPRTPATACRPRTLTPRRRPGLTPTLQLRPQERRREPRCPREVGPSRPRPGVLDPQPAAHPARQDRGSYSAGRRTRNHVRLGWATPPGGPPPAAPGSSRQAAGSCPHGPEVGPPPTTRTPRAGAGSPDSLLQWGPRPAGAGRVGHSRFAPIRDSMRSRRLWRSRWTMKSSSERTRKDDTQLTTRRIPLAMESSRLPPSAGGRAALRGPAPHSPSMPISPG